MVVDISLLKHEKCHRRGRTICFSCWFRGRMFCWLNSNHRDESMTIARLNDITFWSIYPRVRCLNGESVSYWCDSFLYFSSFCLILILFVFSLFLFFYDEFLFSCWRRCLQQAYNATAVIRQMRHLVLASTSSRSTLSSGEENNSSSDRELDDQPPRPKTVTAASANGRPAL